MIILLYLAFLTAQITAVYHHDPKTYDEDELHIVVLGDFGKSENKSKIKANVVKQIKERNKEKPYGKGILLGDNYYPDGLTRGDFSPIHKVFSDSFTATEFPIDFLSVLGNHGYHGDIETFIQYYNHDKRYYQPARYYLYTVNMPNTVVRFVCVDSTPLIYEDIQNSFCLDDKVQKENLKKMVRDHSPADYTFLVVHHSPMVAFGPHTEGGNHNFLTELLDTFEFTAILSGHNHNLQWVPKHGGWKVPQITVGSSAKLSPTTIDKTGGNGWSHDKSGGFGHLTITRTGATFEFVDENGNSLKTVQLARRASA